MKIAIISDSHDNIPRIDEMLKKIQAEDIKTIIHCGDVCSNKTLKYLSNNFSGKIYLSLGNVDIDHNINFEIQSSKNLKIFPKFGEVEVNNTKIAFVHFPEKAKKLAQTNKYDYVFYGHTHRAWEEKISSCYLVNPGTLAGLFAKSTFAILDTGTKNLQLIIL